MAGIPGLLRMVTMGYSLSTLLVLMLYFLLKRKTTKVILSLIFFVITSLVLIFLLNETFDSLELNGSVNTEWVILTVAGGIIFTISAILIGYSIGIKDERNERLAHPAIKRSRNIPFYFPILVAIVVGIVLVFPSIFFYLVNSKTTYIIQMTTTPWVQTNNVHSINLTLYFNESLPVKIGVNEDDFYLYLCNPPANNSNDCEIFTSLEFTVSTPDGCPGISISKGTKEIIQLILFTDYFTKNNYSQLPNYVQYSEFGISQYEIESEMVKIPVLPNTNSSV